MRIRVELLFVLALGLSAQVNKSNLVGVVRDSSGAAVPGVTIRITNTGTGAVRQEVTDDSGLYRASLLDVGTYSLEAEKTGFKKILKPGILLPVGETVTADFALEVGALAETVTVSAQGEQLRTETGSIGSTLESQSLAKLPTIGRNPYVFVALTAGIQYTGDPTYVNPWDASGPSAFTANGFGSGTSQFLLDGVPNMRMDVVSFSPSPDAVEEMRAQTNAFDAEYGHSGAAFINVTTKGGTNDVHGAVYDYLRNEFLNANDFFSNRSGLKKSKFHQDTYGGSIGGPVTLPRLYKGRDRTFFFFDYEGTTLRQGGNTASIVPTVLQRGGDFSQTFNNKGQLITVYDPSTTVLGSNGKYTRTPFSGNVIPKAMLDPVAQNLLKFYALPNLIPAPGTLQNFVGDGVPSGVSTRSWNSLITRVDHRINGAQSLFFRFGWNHRTDTTKPYYGIPGADSVLGDADGFFRSNFGGAMGYTWTINSRTVLDVRAGITRYGEGNIEDTLGMDMTTLGFPGQLCQVHSVSAFPHHHDGYRRCAEPGGRQHAQPQIHQSVQSGSQRPQHLRPSRPEVRNEFHRRAGQQLFLRTFRRQLHLQPQFHPGARSHGFQFAGRIRCRFVCPGHAGKRFRGFQCRARDYGQIFRALRAGRLEVERPPDLEPRDAIRA